MAAGSNVHVRVWRMENSPVDDAVGGAIITGSLAYDGLHTRLEAQRPSQLLLQQGVETAQTFSMLVRPSTLLIYEQDEVEITHPVDHPLYGKRMQIVAITHSNFHPRDPRNGLILNLVRTVRSHTKL